MKVDEKYLPSEIERISFLETRIAENKKQLFGGQMEIATSKDNQTNIDQTEYMMKQLIRNIDIYEEELKKITKNRGDIS